MQNFRMRTAGKDEEDFSVIHSVVSALPGTFLIHAWPDGTQTREVVVLWGVMLDGSPEPITMDGVWGGSDGRNMCVLFPDGSCARFEDRWPDLETAVAELGKYGPAQDT